MMFASIAFSVDTMLPALGQIGKDLSPEAPNRSQFVVSSFILGMGIGTLLVGPISDAYGRKPVILGASVLYFAGTYAAYTAQSIEVMVWARILQGLGAAGPRAVGMALVRDLYSGREMARIMSFAMMVFSLIPAVAPLAGSFIFDIWGWREIFLAFMIFMLITVIWYGTRQPETLPPEHRTALNLSNLWDGCMEILRTRVAIFAMLVLSLTFGMLFATLVTIQPIFDVTYGRADSFPWYFALTAILSMSGALINARLVVPLGMRRLLILTLAAEAVLSFVMAGVFGLGVLPDQMSFVLFFIWYTSVFWIMGLTIGNLNALALEPLGHIAGLAASVVSAAATVLSIFVATPIGLAFDGTPLPLMLGVGLSAIVAVGLMFWLGERDQV